MQTFADPLIRAAQTASERTALIFAGRENLPVTAKLAQVTGERGNAWHLLTASGMISMILPIIVFFALQRYFVRGLLAGAVKG